MKKSLLLSLALGLGLVANAEKAWVPVTSEGQLEAGANYKIVAHSHHEVFGGDAILTHVNNTTTWPKLTAETENAAGAIWTFEAATNNCNVGNHADVHKAFYVKNDGRYFTKAANNAALKGASMPTYETPNEYGSIFEFVPLTSLVETEGLYTWGIHVRFSSDSGYTTIFPSVNPSGNNDQGTEKSAGYTEWYLLNNLWTNHYLLYKEVEITDPRQVYEADYTTAKEQLATTKTIGDELNQYHFTNGTTPADWANYPEELDAIWEATTFDAEAFAAKVAAIREAYNAMAINMPVAGSFIRVKMSAAAVAAENCTGDYYLGNRHGYHSNAAGGASQPRYVTLWDQTPTETNIFYWDGTHLINVASGVYMTATSYGHLHPGTTNVDANGVLDNPVGEIRFENGATDESGVYALVSVATDNGNLRYCHNHVLTGKDYTNEMSTNSCGTPGSHVAHNINLEYVTELPYAIGENGAATITAPVDLQVSAGVDAYIAAAASNVLTLTKVTVIPANTPALLVGTPGAYSFAWAPAAAAAEEGEAEVANTAVYGQQLIGLRTAAEGNVLLALTGYADGVATFSALNAENNVMPAHCMIIEAKADALTEDGTLAVTVADGATTNLVYVEPSVEQEYTWEYTFASANDLSMDADKELNGAMWGITNIEYLGFDSQKVKGIQIGSSKKPAGTEEPTIVIGKTFANASKITKIEVNASGAKNVVATMGVKVGQTAFTTTNDAETVDVTTTATDYVWEGDATGEVNIIFNQTSSVALYIKSIKVTYIATKEIKTREVEDVEFENIADLIKANNDFDNVILKNPVTVVFQNNQNLFVQDATGAMQIFGNVGVTLTAGQTLTGVKGKYSLYNGYTPEIVNPVADSFTLGDGELPEPTVLTAALATTDANKYVKVTGATVVNGETLVATVGDVEYTLINAYNIEGVEDAENVTLTGIVNVTKTGLCRIYLLSYEVVELPDYTAYHISAGTANAWNSIRIDDSILGEHNPGACDDNDLRTRNFTYSAWIRPHANGILMGMKPDEFRNNQGVFQIYTSSNKLNWQYREALTKATFNGSSQTNVCDVELNEWMFLTVVADQEAHKTTLYKDGEEVSSFETTYGVGLLPDNVITMYIADAQMDMDVEQVQVWTKALSPAEVRQSYLMTRESEVPDELVGFYFVSNGESAMTNLGKGSVDAVLTEYKSTTINYPTWTLATETKTGNSVFFSLDTEGHVQPQAPEVQYYTVSVSTVEGQYSYEFASPADEYAEGSEVTVIFERQNDDARVLSLKANNADVTDAMVEYDDQPGSYEYTFTVNDDVVLILDSDLFYTLTVNTDATHFTYEVENAAEEYQANQSILVKFTKANENAFVKSFTHNDEAATLSTAAEGAAHHFEYTVDGINAHTTLSLVSDLDTGINAIVVENGDDVRIYDLQGRRLNKTATGVYIINGQKVRL